MTHSTLPLVIKAAIDLGNGYVKVGHTDATGITTVTMLPSVVGLGDTNRNLVSAGLRRKAQNKPRLVKIDQTTFLVGENVAGYGRPVERLDPGRFAGGTELRALVYAALADLFDPGETDMAAVVGLPVELLQAANARRIVRDVKKWMKAEHRFYVADDYYKIRLRDVQVVAQPMGTYFLWGAGPNGVWLRDKLDLETSTAVLDTGFGSLDLLVVEDAQVNPRWTTGRNLGMRRACVLVQDLVFQAHSRELSMHEADALIGLHLANKPATIAAPGGPVNVKDLVKTALDMAMGEAVAFVDNRWGKGSQFSYILLTGGGALAYEPAFARQFAHSVLLDDPQTANVRGLSYLANRPKFLKG